MTATATPQSPVEIQPSRPARKGLITATGLFAVAFALRYFRIVPSYNLFIDEVTYSEIARNIAHGHGVTHYGQPFDLHPPVVLSTYGLVIRLLGLHGDLADLAFALRPVAALFGSATVVLTFLISRRMGLGLSSATAAAALIALDPFQISYDSRVMLEAQTQFFAALTILLVMHLAQKDSRRLILAAGFSAGLTFCSKETFGLVLGAALILIALSNRIAPRRTMAAIIGIGLGTYLANLGLTIWSGGLNAWTQARGNGLTRLIGLNQETGFGSPEVKVSLASRLTANLDQLAVTYALLLLGGICGLLLLHRLIHRRGTLPGEAAAPVAWTLAACGYLSYATIFGSIEEQMYYIPLLPCVLCVVACFRKGWWVALIPLFLAVDAVVWTRVHTTDSNIYRQFLTWSETGIPSNSRVALTEDSAQFVLQGLSLGSWHTADELRANRVDYVLINPHLVEQGYGVGDPGFLNYLETKATPVFRATSKQDGTLLLYDVRALDHR